MRRVSSLRHPQRGAVTLFISLIMLVVITGIVLAAFTMSTTNLRSVGNLQWRNEAVAAANMVLQDRISADFTSDLSAVTRTVDLNNDDVDDYTVSVSAPVCVRASKVVQEVYSSVTLPIDLSAAGQWITIWEMVATVSDEKTGASVRVRQGARVLLYQVQKTSVCPG